MRQQRLLSRILIVHLVVALMLTAACAHRVNTGASVTPWEQVMTTNAQIASANSAIERAVENANAANLIPTDKAALIIREQANIASAHYQISAILHDGPDAAKGKSPQVIALVAQMQKSVAAMTSTGVIGVKDPQTQQSVTASVQMVGSLADTLLVSLRAAGVIQ